MKTIFMQEFQNVSCQFCYKSLFSHKLKVLYLPTLFLENIESLRTNLIEIKYVKIVHN